MIFSYLLILQHRSFRTLTQRDIDQDCVVLLQLCPLQNVCPVLWVLFASSFHKK